jgi:hypothetical protein
MPWHDTGEIVKAIRNRMLDEKVIEAVKNDNTKYIKFEDDKYRKLHAEMKIISKLFEKKPEETFQCIIGLTKLTCYDCQAVISVLNNEGHSLKTCSDESHGKEYES